MATDVPVEVAVVVAVAPRLNPTAVDLGACNPAPPSVNPVAAEPVAADVVARPSFNPVVGAVVPPSGRPVTGVAVPPSVTPEVVTLPLVKGGTDPRVSPVVPVRPTVGATEAVGVVVVELRVLAKLNPGVAAGIVLATGGTVAAVTPELKLNPVPRPAVVVVVVTGVVVPNA